MLLIDDRGVSQTTPLERALGRTGLNFFPTALYSDTVEVAIAHEPIERHLGLLYALHEVSALSRLFFLKSVHLQEGRGNNTP